MTWKTNRSERQIQEVCSFAGAWGSFLTIEMLNCRKSAYCAFAQLSIADFEFFCDVRSGRQQAVLEGQNPISHIRKNVVPGAEMAPEKYLRNREFPVSSGICDKIGRGRVRSFLLVLAAIQLHCKMERISSFFAIFPAWLLFDCGEL